MEEIAPGVFLENNFVGGNCGLILTDKGSILIDPPMLPVEARLLQEKMKELGLGSLYAIVNTDYHLEHYLGNAWFLPARVIGHEESEKPLLKYDQEDLERIIERYHTHDPTLRSEMPPLPLATPQLSVGDRMTLHLGTRVVQILYMEGHTPASLGVYLPQERILFAGDNVTNNEHPDASQANSLAWLETLKHIKEMEVDIIIPGAGAPCGKEAIDPLYEYLAEMRRRVLEMFQQGASRRECVEKVGMLEYFPIPKGQEGEIKLRRRRSVERIYTEIRLALRRKG